MPEKRMFIPAPKQGAEPDVIVLSVDEYETLRLMDYVGMSQLECSQSMEVARTTVQKIYSDARAKVAEALVTSKAIKIEGGDVREYSNDERMRAPGRCMRHGGRGGRGHL